jgi:hypothetical protein
LLMWRQPRLMVENIRNTGRCTYWHYGPMQHALRQGCTCAALWKSCITLPKGSIVAVFQMKLGNNCASLAAPWSPGGH